jgi:uncharacterized membrane protein
MRPGQAGQTEQRQHLLDATIPLALFAPDRHRIRTAALTLLCFGAMLATGFQQWGSARIGGFDLGIFDQAIRAYAHLHLPRSPIKNYHHEYPPGFSILGDHFSPILVLLAPLYWVWDDPRVLLVAQAALFAAGVPLVRRVARRCFADVAPWAAHRAIDICGLVYGLGWPLFMASRDGFHEVAFAVPLVLLMLERGAARRYGAVAVCAFLLLCTKEDLGLAVAVYGAVLAARGHRSGDPRGVRTGLTLLVLGPVATALAIRVFIPVMGGVPGYYWNYGGLGPDIGSVVVRLVTQPGAALFVAIDNWTKISLLLWLLVPLLFLPLRSPVAWCTLPLLAERLFSDVPSHWSMSHHYDAFLWPFLIVAAIEAAARLHRREQQRAVRWGATAATACLALAAGLGLARIADPARWAPAPYQQALVEAAALVPNGATVEADNGVAPHLTSRTHTVIADRTPRGAEFVLLQTVQRSFPFESAADQRDRAAFLLDHGYARVWSRDGVVLLRRVGHQPLPGEHVPGPGSTPVKDLPAPPAGRP